MSSERDMEKLDARFGELFPDDGAPGEAGEEAAVAAVLAALARRRSRALWFRLAAAAVLIAAGFGLGLLSRSRTPSRSQNLVTSAMADHERAVFAAVRESLGEDLAWLATHDGEVVLGFGDQPRDAALRVVFVELRTGDGEVASRTKIVLPEGWEARLTSDSAPEMRVAALAESGGGRVSVAVDFPDGARLAGFGSVAAGGEGALVGRVRTNGETVSVYLSAF